MAMKQNSSPRLAALLAVLLLLTACYSLGAAPTNTLGLASTLAPTSTLAPSVVAPTASPTSAPPAEVSPSVQAGEAITVSLPTMMDETTGWAMVYGGGLVRTTDGGESWTNVTPPNQASSAFFLDAQSAWAYINGDPASGLLHTADGGQTWSSVASSPPFDGYISLSFQNENDGWAEQYDVGAGNAYVTLFETHDGGATWTQVMLSTPDDPGEQPGVLHLCNICGDYFYFDAQRMLIIYGELANDPAGRLALSLSTDGGKTWRDETLPFPAEEYASGLVSPQAPVFFNDRDGLLPFGLITYNSDGSHGIDVSTLYATHDGGLSWTTNPSVVEGAGGSRTGIHIVTPQDALVPCGKDLCATHDGGGSWQALGANLNFTYTSDAERYVMQFQFLSPLAGWATTDLNGQSGLWHTTDGGKTWVELKPVRK